MTHSIPEALPWVSIDAAIRGRAEDSFRLLEELVRMPTLAGQERSAQELLAARLRALGFVCRWIPLSDDIADMPGAGRPRAPCAGRHVLLGSLLGASLASLVLNGHIDVVPAEDEILWTASPFEPFVRNGWMIGRGAGDMKAGLVAVLLALEALAAEATQAMQGRLQVVVVPEEESSGNGTLASIRDGVLGDAVLLPEPTDLKILLSGIGVLWCEVSTTSRGAHAGGEDGFNPIPSLMGIVQTLTALAARLSAADTMAAKQRVHHNANLGELRAGDWPSSVPTSATATVRIGFPAKGRFLDVKAEVESVVQERVLQDEWLMRHPPKVAFPGLRAEPHALVPTHPLVTAAAAAHRAAHGSNPDVAHGSATSDARHYINHANLPALCYGPRAINIHGVDEAVDLSSIVACARTYARLIPMLLHSPVSAPSLHSGK